MKVKALEKSKDKNTVMLHIQETTPHYLNTMRRMLMNEVPVLAIEDVEFRNNSSILYDEMVAHRLGLIPIKTDLKSYEMPKGDKETAKTHLKLTLKEKAGKEPKMVYAKDIKSKDKKAVPVYDETPIVKLQPGQEIEVEMTAILGQGLEHSKWSPCLAWFKYYPHIKVKKQPKNAKELAEKYSPVLEVKSGKLQVNQDAALKHDIIDESIEKETDGAVVYEEKDDFVFFIESWGQMDAKALFEAAIDMHNEQLKEFKKLVKKA